MNLPLDLLLLKIFQVFIPFGLFIFKSIFTDSTNKLCYNLKKRGILFMSVRTRTIPEMNLEDDFLFQKVMSETKIYRKVLEKISNAPMPEQKYEYGGI